MASETYQNDGTGFTQFLLLCEKPPDGCMWSGERLTKNTSNKRRPHHLCPESWSRISEAAQRKEKQQWAIEKPKLDKCRKVKEASFLLIWMITNSKKPIQKRSEKIEIAISKQRKSWMQKPLWTRNGEKSRNIASMVNVRSSRAKKMVMEEARKEQSTSPFCYAKWTSCHKPEFQKYKGRVVLRGDVVKDDSGSYAVVTGQGCLRRK